jgi:hypothetical protein
MAWPHSQLLGRPLEVNELEQVGPYLTMQVGGPLDGFVMLTANAETRRVSVLARWGSSAARREASLSGMNMTSAEGVAAQWADELGAGYEPNTA